jgi:acyl homoserine lactone synthase
MFIVVQKHEYKKYPTLLDQAFRLRKRVFFDRLGWDVSVEGDFERDAYDELGPAYLMWANDAADTLYGTVRLMPTTGPTLLFDVFGSTFPDTALSAPGIWEGTRMCIDDAAIRRDFPHLSSARAFSLLLLALCECGLDYGIHTLVSNYEPYFRRVYRRAGLRVAELGRADGYGRFPVCCGIFEVTEETRQVMRRALNITRQLYQSSRAMTHKERAPERLSA